MSSPGHPRGVPGHNPSKEEQRSDAIERGDTISQTPPSQIQSVSAAASGRPRGVPVQNPSKEEQRSDAIERGDTISSKPPSQIQSVSAAASGHPRGVPMQNPSQKGMAERGDHPMAHSSSHMSSSQTVTADRKARPEMDSVPREMRLLWEDYNAAPRSVREKVDQLLAKDEGEIMDTSSDADLKAGQGKRTAGQAFSEDESDSGGEIGTKFSKLQSLEGVDCIFQVNKGPIYGRLGEGRKRDAQSRTKPWYRSVITMDPGKLRNQDTNRLGTRPYICLSISSGETLLMGRWNFDSLSCSDWHISKLKCQKVSSAPEHSLTLPTEVVEDFRGSSLLDQVLCVEFDVTFPDTYFLQGNRWKSYFDAKFIKSFELLFRPRREAKPRHVRLWFLAPPYPQDIRNKCVGPMIDALAQRVNPLSTFENNYGTSFLDQRQDRIRRGNRGPRHRNRPGKKQRQQSPVMAPAQGQPSSQSHVPGDKETEPSRDKQLEPLGKFPFKHAKNDAVLPVQNFTPQVRPGAPFSTSRRSRPDVVPDRLKHLIGQNPQTGKTGDVSAPGAASQANPRDPQRK